VSLRDLPPVEPNVDRPEYLSQSFLARQDVCARSAFLYQKHRGGPSTHAMDRGSAYHEWFHRFVDLLVEQGENSAPPDVAKELLADVLADNPHWQIPEPEQDALRVMVFHTAEALWINPSEVVALETMLELDIDGVKVRGRVDFAAITPSARHATIWDAKTGWVIPSQETFDRSWQTRFYALLLAEGKASEDPVPIGKGIETFTVAELYPRYKNLPERKTTLTRQQLADFKLDVSAVIARAQHGFDTGLWPAVPGDHCSTCPAAWDCPLPEILIPAAVDDRPEALAEREQFLDSEHKTVMKKLKSIAEDSGPIQVGGYEYAFKLTESERVDKDAVKAALERGGSDPSEFFKKSVSTRFSRRKAA
jgi:hypothetical protein